MTRAPAPEGPEKPKIVIAHGQAPGGLAAQADSLRVRHEAAGVLAVIADGMGGRQGGDLAATLAADGFAMAFGSRSAAPADQRLALGLAASNQAVASARASGRGEPDMACALSAVYAEGELVYWISVGASSIHHWTRGQVLRRISADHSMAPVLDEAARRGLRTHSEAISHPERRALRSMVKGEAIELTDAGVMVLAEGAILVLASDGLDTLSDAEIVRQLERSRGDPQRAVAELLAAAAARSRPEQDNISVVVLSHPPRLQREPQPRRMRARRRSINWRSPRTLGLAALILLLTVVAVIVLLGAD